MRFDPQRIISLIDLTSLNDTDDAATITALCKKAVTPSGHVAAICVYPKFVAQVKTQLPQATIAAVANFPQGTDSLENTVQSIHQSIAAGANEMDVVFPYQDYLRGEHKKTDEFIRACKAACGENVLLKVILETGALQDPALIAEISYQVSYAGADFLKTSTGKIPVGATVEAVCAMLQTLKKIPRAIGCKVSGGIRTVYQAMQYLNLAEEIMGSAWVTPAHFRIGASQLLNELIDGLRTAR